MRPDRPVTLSQGFHLQAHLVFAALGLDAVEGLKPITAAGAKQGAWTPDPPFRPIDHL